MNPASRIDLTDANLGYPRAAELAPLAWYPANAETAPAVLIAPALGTPAGVYRRLAESLVTCGAHVGVIEMRGVGASAVRARRGVDWGYADLVDGEIAYAISLLRQRVPGPLFSLGHSLGGHALLLHQARYPAHALNGIALVASGTPFGRQFRGFGRFAVNALGAAGEIAGRTLGYFPGDALRFGGRQGARLMREWAALVRTGHFPQSLWPGGNVATQLATLRTPLLSLAIPGDKYAPPAALDHLLSLAGSKTRHEPLPMSGLPGHFGWLKEPAPVAARVVDWMRTMRAR